MKQKTVILLFIHLLGFNNLIKAQDFKTEYYYQFEGLYSEIHELSIDADNNVYVAGWLTGEVDLDPSETVFNSPEDLYRDLFVAKYNDNNELLSGFFIKGYQNKLSSMDVDDQGNIYLTGTFIGEVDFDPGEGVHELSTYDTGGGSRMFIAKYSSNGELSWVHQFGNQNFNSWAQDLYFNKDRISLRVTVRGEFDFDPGPSDVISNVSGNAILELDLDGNYIWSVVVDDNMDFWNFSVDDNQNFIIAGRFRYTINLDFKGSQEETANIGDYDAYIAKYDKNHNLLWYDVFGDSFDEDRFSNIAIDKDDNILATAYIESEIELGGTTIDKNYRTFIKYAPNGDYIDVLNLLPQTINIETIKSDNNNNLYFLGNFNKETDFDPSMEEHIITPEEGKGNIFLFKLSNNYNLTSINTLYGTYLAHHKLEIDSNNYVYVSNSFTDINSIIFGEEIAYDNTDIEENAVYQKISPLTCSASANEIILAGCDSVFVNNIHYTASGTYEQILVNNAGCDSVLTIEMTVENSSIRNISFDECDFIEINGENYNTTGQYTQVISNQNGCDSTIFLDINISTVDIGVDLEMGVLNSLETEADSYQWIDCSNNLDIEGENSNFFEPSITGDYAVRVEKQFCSKKSDCVNVIISSTKDVLDTDIIIYPNPANNFITIENGQDMSNEIQIIGLDGRSVGSRFYTLKNNQIIVDISKFECGIYFIKLTDGKTVINKKFIKI